MSRKFAMHTHTHTHTDRLTLSVVPRRISPLPSILIVILRLPLPLSLLRIIRLPLSLISALAISALIVSIAAGRVIVSIGRRRIVLTARLPVPAAAMRRRIVGVAIRARWRGSISTAAAIVRILRRRLTIIRVITTLLTAMVPAAALFTYNTEK